MAKRSRRLNPDEARRIRRDIDDVVQGSATIDVVYDEYDQTRLDLAHYLDILENLRENKQSVPRELRASITASKIRLRELDRRIAQYGRLMLKRAQARMDIVRNSPGAAFNKPQIREVDRAIFKTEQKYKRKGSDIRPDLSRLMGMVVTLEQDSGIILRKPGKKVDKVSRRKAEEAELFGQLVDQWKKVHRHAKKDPRVQEDIDWVTAQLRSLDLKFKRGDSVRRGIERVAKRVQDIHNRTKPRKTLKGPSDAKKGIRDFVVVIQEYSQEDVTAAGVDKLKYELEKFSRQFTPKAKAEWSADDRRKFARDLRNLRKALDAIRPKGRRKKNPCVGLHFHGKDSDELLKALESSAQRQSKKVKKNPGGPAFDRTPEAAALMAKLLRKEIRAPWVDATVKPGKYPSVIILFSATPKSKWPGGDFENTPHAIFSVKPDGTLETVRVGGGLKRLRKSKAKDYVDVARKLDVWMSKIKVDGHGRLISVNPKKTMKKNPGTRLKRNDLVEITVGMRGGKQIFAGRVTDVTSHGYGIREGDFFTGPLGRSRRALSLIQGGEILSVGRESFPVKKIRVVARVTDHTPPRVKILVKSYEGHILHANPKKNPGKKNPKKKAAKKNPTVREILARERATWRKLENQIAQVKIDSGKVVGVEITNRVLYGPPLKRGHQRIVVDVRVPKYKEYDAAKEAIETRIEEVLGVRPEYVMSDGHLMHWTVPMYWTVTKGAPKGTYVVTSRNPKKSPNKNPTKKNPKKKATRKKTPKYQLLINRCQKLWDNHCDKPTKKNLKLVLAHLEKMKESTSEKVKKERSRCLRAANKEAKRLKMK